MANMIREPCFISHIYYTILVLERLGKEGEFSTGELLLYPL